MACFRQVDKQKFPLRNIEDFVGFFEEHLKNSNEPNLALISIILGCVENSLTCNRSVIKQEKESNGKTEFRNLPLLELSKVEALYQRFVAFVKGSIDSTNKSGPYTPRECVKRISDVIWSGLTSNYTDKAHLQSLYSYLTGNKLDCFGVALAVVAACQILGYDDVHLSLSEDHAWVVFGEDGRETAEVTWHGKGVEDRRGQPIRVGGAEHGWLYLDEHPVVCNRHMELAAIVASINPAINATSDSVEMARLQQQLLWILYDKEHLDKYPMALGTLGDLEEIDPTPGRPCCEDIYKQGVNVARLYYNNHHVYPHTYMGAFYYRKGLYKEALRHWTEAAEVISRYNYGRDDEEIYKEFLEIAHDLIPHIAKLASDGYLIGSSHHKTVKALQLDDSKQLPFLKDKENYELILKFYDGICEWEEGSSTPVLHITWAKHFVTCINKFDKSMRGSIEVEKEPGDESTSSSSSSASSSDESDSDSEVDRDVVIDDKKESRKCVTHPQTTNTTTKIDSDLMNVETNVDLVSQSKTVLETQSNVDNNNEDVKQTNDQKIKNTIERLTSKIDVIESESNTESGDANIADLAKACADGILNPDFLLGKGEPFTTSMPTSMFTTVTDSKSHCNDLSLLPSNGTLSSNGYKAGGQPVTNVFSKKNLTHTKSIPSVTIAVQHRDADISRTNSKRSFPFHKHHHSQSCLSVPKLQFRSAKMKGLKGLLTSQRLNNGAIYLQMTAQSQVSFKHNKTSSSSKTDLAPPRKRTRRGEAT